MCHIQIIAGSPVMSRSNSWSHSSEYTSEASKGINTSVAKVQQPLENFVADVTQDERTTVMVRDVPFLYKQRMLIDELKEFGFDFNFLYLPNSRTTNSCLGYAFVNFRSHEEACEFIRMFSGVEFRHQATESQSRSATLEFAKLQGFEANVKFYGQMKLTKCRFRPYVEQ